MTVLDSSYSAPSPAFNVEVTNDSPNHVGGDRMEGQTQLGTWGGHKKGLDTKVLEMKKLSKRNGITCLFLISLSFLCLSFNLRQVLSILDELTGLQETVKKVNITD